MRSTHRVERFNAGPRTWRAAGSQTRQRLSRGRVAPLGNTPPRTASRGARRRVAVLDTPDRTGRGRLALPTHFTSQRMAASCLVRAGNSVWPPLHRAPGLRMDGGPKPPTGFFPAGQLGESSAT